MIHNSYVATLKGQKEAGTRHVCSASSAQTETNTVNPADVAAGPPLSARGMFVVGRLFCLHSYQSS